MRGPPPCGGVRFGKAEPGLGSVLCLVLHEQLLSFVTEIQFVTLTGGDVWSHWVQLGRPSCLAPSSECRSVAASAEEACVYESPSRQGRPCPRSSPCSLWLVISFKETNARCISYKDFT